MIKIGASHEPPHRPGVGASRQPKTVRPRSLALCLPVMWWQQVRAVCGGRQRRRGIDPLLERRDAGDVVDALGLQLHELFPPNMNGSPPLKRRGMLTAGQALEVIAFECLLAWTAAFNLANGHALTAEDLGRLSIAVQRIQALAIEVRS